MTQNTQPGQNPNQKPAQEEQSSTKTPQQGQQPEKKQDNQQK